MSLFTYHLYNEFRLTAYFKRRYWAESVMSIIFIMVILLGLVLLISSVGNTDLKSGELDGLIVGFVLWFFAINSYSSASSDIAEETRQRTIEQLYIGPKSLCFVLTVRAVNHVVTGLVALITGLGVLQWLAGDRLHIDYLPMIGTALLAASSLIGIGYAVAGLLLLLKKIEIVHGVLYFGLISLVALPAYDVPVLALLPYALGADTVRHILKGESIASITYLMIGLNSGVYLGVGLLLFQCLEDRAKKSGVLGHW